MIIFFGFCWFKKYHLKIIIDSIVLKTKGSYHYLIFAFHIKFWWWDDVVVIRSPNEELILEVDILKNLTVFLIFVLAHMEVWWVLKQTSIFQLLLILIFFLVFLELKFTLFFLLTIQFVCDWISEQFYFKWKQYSWILSCQNWHKMNYLNKKLRRNGKKVQYQIDKFPSSVLCFFCLCLVYPSKENFPLFGDYLNHRFGNQQNSDSSSSETLSI